MASANNLSIYGNYWDLPEDTNIPNEILKAAYEDKLLAKVLLRRGFNSIEKINSFFNLTDYEMISGFELPNMQQACTTTIETMAKNVNITVYGDYDVDGITGASVLKLLFKYLKYENVNYYIPNRFTDGYGLNTKAITNIISKQKAKLIITCDCGVTNLNEIAFAKSFGAQTIVLDHHNMAQTLPPAAAIVHPKLLKDTNHGLYNLSGVGVAFKFAQSMLEIHNLRAALEDFYEYAALGLIADMVPLTKENRYIVNKGLNKFATTNKPGLKALIEQTQNNSKGDLVGYNIAPKINAAGRLSDGFKALELLTTQDPIRASELSQELQSENIKRQELTETIFNDANLTVETLLRQKEKLNVIAIFKENWHHGVVGIVATRLLEKYKLPVFIGEIMPDTQIVKGSARGYEQFDLYEALNHSQSSLLKWGGHKVAAGFTFKLEELSNFQTLLAQYAKIRLEQFNEPNKLVIDTIIEKTDLDLQNFRNFEKMAPFGMSNPKPQVLIKNITCLDNFWLGKTKQHLKLTLINDNNEKFESFIWNCRQAYPKPGDTIDLVFIPEIKTYKNKAKLNMIFQDWKLVSTSNENHQQSYESAINNTNLNSNEINNLKSSQPNHLEPKVPIGITPTQSVRINSLVFQKQTWKDLRFTNNANEIIYQGYQKLGDNLAVFAEQEHKDIKFPTLTRLDIGQVSHLVFLDFPPTDRILKEIIANSQTQNIFLVSPAEYPLDNPALLIKQLTGICRYIINKLTGVVNINKVASKLQTSTEAIITGLKILNQVNIFDWYIEGDELFLDQLDTGTIDKIDPTLFKELETTINSISTFRHYLKTTNLNDIAKGLFTNKINLHNPQYAETDLDKLHALKNIINNNYFVGYR